MSELGKLLVLAGLILVVGGLILMLFGRTNLPLGRLPGDIIYRGKNTTFYFPLATSILLSVVLSLILYLVGRSTRPLERRIWTVRDLVSTVRTHIEREYGDVWVEGEISNFRAHDSGHLYFTLKDQNAQIRAVMFRSSARLLRFRPDDGMQIVLRGRVTIYEDRGELQICAEYLEPKGAGALQVAFEQLKAKLEAEGLFDSSRKKAIPVLPSRIGIVSSPQAAALRDILNILRRRLALPLE